MTTRDPGYARLPCNEIRGFLSRQEVTLRAGTGAEKSAGHDSTDAVDKSRRFHRTGPRATNDPLSNRLRVAHESLAHPHDGRYLDSNDCRGR